MKELLVTQEALKQFFKYDPETGALTKKKFVGNQVIDFEVGFIDKASRSEIRYRAVEFLGRKFRVHRLAWFYMTGEWPAYIDHIDGDGLNNKWENLRDVVKRENALNRKLNKNSTTGIPGVSWITSRNHYKVAISIDGKKKTLGYTKDFFEACCMRKSAEIEHKYHANHGRVEP